jgi:uncharacterized protein YjeT (DUF2065 family)
MISEDGMGAKRELADVLVGLGLFSTCTGWRVVVEENLERPDQVSALRQCGLVKPAERPGERNRNWRPIT